MDGTSATPSWIADGQWDKGRVPSRLHGSSSQGLVMECAFVFLSRGTCRSPQVNIDQYPRMYVASFLRRAHIRSFRLLHNRVKHSDRGIIIIILGQMEVCEFGNEAFTLGLKN